MMDPDRRHELFAACALFDGVAKEDLGPLIERATEIAFPTGHVIARQGEIGSGFFVIGTGRVRVVRDGSTITELGPGDFFGELSVIDRLPRNASVTATAPTTCWAIASWDFDAALSAHAPLALAILRGLARRLRATTDAASH